MNETRSTHRRGRTSGRLAMVLCLFLAVALLPAAASAIPGTVTDANSMYLNSASIALQPACSYTLDGGPTVDATTSLKTSVYGAHILALNTTWKDVSTGTSHTVMTIPFFVEDDVVPTVTCDAVASYRQAASVAVTATDNFTGSGIDSLYYRIDGGNIVQVVSKASDAAVKASIAALPLVKVTAMAPVDPTKPVPSGHLPKTPEQCPLCHDIIAPTPEPTSTPDPTSTPTPQGGLCKVVSVTGVGTHTIECWASDIARNESAHVTKSFTITGGTFTLTYTAGTGGSIVGSCTQSVDSGSDGAFVTATPATGYHFVSWSDGVTSATHKLTNVVANHTVTATFASALIPTSLTITPNRYTATHGATMSLSGIVTPNQPNGTNVGLYVKNPGSSKWVRVTTFHTYSSHHWKGTWRVPSRGVYYFKVMFTATSAYAAGTSRVISVTTR